jgi:ABC-type Fe3+ transport system substrate-binding protein
MPISLVGTLFLLLSAICYDLVRAQQPWQVQWEETVRAAEREGRVVIYGDNTVESLLLEGFQKKYPKIKVIMETASGNDLAKRLLTERRAGKYLADLFIPGSARVPVSMLPAKPFDPIAPLFILPEVSDPSKWWQGKYHYVDPEGQYIFLVGGAASSGGIFYNTQLINPHVIKSFWDLVDSRWKGKIVAMDPFGTGPAGVSLIFFYHHTELGPTFIRSLFKDTALMLARSDEQLIDWVAVGKFAFGLFPRASALARAVKTGLPVKEFPSSHFREGGFISPSALTMNVLNQAPHPKAMTVVINWFLSREGQTLWLEYLEKIGSPQDPIREDVPKDKVNEGKREPGAKYFNTQKYDLITNTQPMMDLIKRSLEESKKP